MNKRIKKLTKIKNKVYNDIMMIILSEEGEEIIIRVKTNTDEEIIDDIAKIRGEIITDEMRRVIKIKRERKEGGNAIPGLGRLTVDAVLARDFPTIQGVILFFSLVYVLVNLLVDLSYVFFDPRIRY